MTPPPSDAAAQGDTSVFVSSSRTALSDAASSATAGMALQETARTEAPAAAVGNATVGALRRLLVPVPKNVFFEPLTRRGTERSDRAWLGGAGATICTSRQVDGGVRAGRCIQSPVWVMRGWGRAVGAERWRRTCVPTPPPPLSRRQNLRLYSKHLRTSDTGQVADSYRWSAAQASFSRHIYGVDKRQEPSNDGCRPCDGSAAASTRRAHARRARQA